MLKKNTLVKKGFHEQADSAVICRFGFEDLLVDIMSTKEIGWARSNRWFEPGFNHSETIHLEDVEVQILPLPYFLASKLDAFFDRGIREL